MSRSIWRLLGARFFGKNIGDCGLIFAIVLPKIRESQGLRHSHLYLSITGKLLEMESMYDPPVRFWQLAKSSVAMDTRTQKFVGKVWLDRRISEQEVSHLIKNILLIDQYELGILDIEIHCLENELEGYEKCV